MCAVVANYSTVATVVKTAVWSGMQFCVPSQTSFLSSKITSSFFSYAPSNSLRFRCLHSWTMP